MTQDHPEQPDPSGADAGDDPELVGDEELQDLDDEGPDASELDDEPDYNPDDGLKDIKGG